MTQPTPVRAPGAGPFLDEQLCFSLYTASHLVTREYAPILAELGLTYPQYVTMIALWEADLPTCVSDLGGRLYMDSGTLTPLLKRLEAKGLATRTRDSADERRVLIGLTPAGTALRATACTVPDRMFQRFGAEPGQLARLKQILDSVITAMERPSNGAG